MNLTAKLTLDGMIRALRWKAHALAEDIEQRYALAQPDEGDGAEREFRRAGAPREMQDDRLGE